MAKKTRVFTAEEWESLGLPYGCEGGEILKDEMVQHKRWSIVHEITFRLDSQPDGEAYLVWYQVPATECQEVEEPKEYNAIVVRATQKMVTAYEPVETE